MNMNDEEFRESVVGHIARMTRAFEKISEDLEYIGSRLDEIRMELIHRPK
jgi:hypothetical protein